VSKEKAMMWRFNGDVGMKLEGVTLEGRLSIPRGVKDIILFSHGSGSSRFSPRNTMVASHLQKNGFGTLLFDLLTAVEDRNHEKRFDIDLLTDRLVEVTKWLQMQKSVEDCRIGYFGASTGAASALKAAARLQEVGAVVCRGGRPDLALEALPMVHCPVLLIVGSLDREVIEPNREALRLMNVPKRLSLIPGATHLFEEPGCMEQVCRLSADWFEVHMHAVKAY
jgi:putative phosphoribosyl transferase